MLVRAIKRKDCLSNNSGAKIRLFRQPCKFFRHANDVMRRYETLCELIPRFPWRSAENYVTLQCVPHSTGTLKTVCKTPLLRPSRSTAALSSPTSISLISSRTPPGSSSGRCLPTILRPSLLPSSRAAPSCPPKSASSTALSAAPSAPADLLFPLQREGEALQIFTLPKRRLPKF